MGGKSKCQWLVGRRRNLTGKMELELELGEQQQQQQRAGRESSDLSPFPTSRLTCSCIPAKLL